MRPSRLVSRSHPRLTRGFTLIELLVVISIIAILAGLLLPVVSSVMEKARKTEAKSTMSEIIAAVKAYQTDYGQYPVDPQATAVDATFDKSTASNSTGKYGHNVFLFNVLRATNATATVGSPTATYKALNSRKVNYFEGKDVKNATTPRSGFIPATATTSKTNLGDVTLLPGDLVGPWGNLYYIRIDSDYSTLVYNPYCSGTSGAGGTTDPTGTTINYGEGLSDQGTITDPSSAAYILRTDVIAWSPGKDGLMGTATSGTGNTVTSPATTPPSVNYGDDVVSWQ